MTFICNQQSIHSILLNHVFPT